jgi:hypothetical protein
MIKNNAVMLRYFGLFRIHWDPEAYEFKMGFMISKLLIFNIFSALSLVCKGFF